MIVPGRRRPHGVRAALARAHARRHDRQRLRGLARARARLAPTTSTTCSRRSTRFFETELGAGRPDRRLRGRAAADLDRRSEEVGGHLAQGGAVRDELGPRHDHRRQAHHLAADGQAGGRPDRRARGPRGALPHARDPARACPIDPRRCRRCRAWTRTAAPTWPPATATPRATCCGWPPRRPELAERISPELPDIVAEARLRRRPRAGALAGRRAAAAHAPRAARRPRADRARLRGRPARGARRWPASSAGTTRASSASCDDWARGGAREGLVPTGARPACRAARGGVAAACARARGGR